MDQDFTVCHPALTRPQVELSDDNSAKRVSPGPSRRSEDLERIAVMTSATQLLRDAEPWNL